VITVLADGPGPRAADVRVEGTRVLCAVPREPVTRADWTSHDYNVHFCLSLRNDGPETDVEILVGGAGWDGLPDTAPLLFAAERADGPWRRLDAPARTDLRTRYALRIRLPAGGVLHVANTVPRSGDRLAAAYDRLGAAAGAERRVYGRSVEGRELVAHLLGDPGRLPTLLVTSGFHPPEPDTLATEAVLGWLAAPEAEALRRRFAVVVAPLCNPDGFARWAQGSNASGINLYWRFAHDMPDACPEAAALWRLASEAAPRGYLDFHCYTFQLGKRPGPYLKPDWHYADPRARAASAAIRRAFAGWPGTKVVRGFPTYAPRTLGAMLTRAFDTVTMAKYHLHLDEGEDGCRAHGLRAFRVLADALAASGLADAGPGARRSAGWREPARAADVAWSGWLRPQLGHLRRGRPDRIRFDREGTEAP